MQAWFTHRGARSIGFASACAQQVAACRPGTAGHESRTVHANTAAQQHALQAQEVCGWTGLEGIYWEERDKRVAFVGGRVQDKEEGLGGRSQAGKFSIIYAKDAFS